MSVLDREDYDEIVDRLQRQSGERARAFLLGVAAALVVEGWDGPGPHTTVDLLEFDCDDYRWSMLMIPPGADQQEDGIDVSIEMCEQLNHEGSFGGITLGVNVVEYGGLIVGGFQPYNYTELCWVPITDTEALATRWDLVLNEGIVVGVIDLLKDHVRQRGLQPT